MRDPILEEVKHGESGQVLALGALSMLLLALMLMMSFNLSQALHEKIQLQQHSDSMTYSMAVVEARAFNYFAYSNRTMAAAYVAMATYHAYMAIISSTVSMLQAARMNFLFIGIEEIGFCCSCGGPWPCCKINHCIHAWKAFQKMGKFGSAANKYGNKAKKIDKQFNKVIKDLAKMIDWIHRSQILLAKDTVQTLAGGNLKKLKDLDAPQASGLAKGVAALNANNFFCTMDYDQLPAFMCKGKKTNATSRKKVMTEVANATRPGWVRSHSYFFLEYMIPMATPISSSKVWNDIYSKIQGNGHSIPIYDKGGAKIMDGTSSGAVSSSQEGTQGKDVGAYENGLLFSYFHDGVMVWPYKGEIYSNQNGGKHNPSQAHDQTHNRFKGVDQGGSKLSGCVSKGDCFIKFRSDSKKDDDFGQPAVYGYFTQDLSVDRQGHHGPWEVSKDGTVSITHGDQGKGSLIMRAGTGAAVSKALVYYHRLGNWREQPNFFNPYWRAKLHRFSRMEASKVLTAATNVKAAGIAQIPNFPVY